MNGILVAITVMNCTFASGGKPAKVVRPEKAVVEFNTVAGGACALRP